MAGDSNYAEDEGANDRITCASCARDTVQCYRIGCKYRLAHEAKCVDCCPCGQEQVSELRTAAAKTNIRLGV